MKKISRWPSLDCYRCAGMAINLVLGSLNVALALYLSINYIFTNIYHIFINFNYSIINISFVILVSSNVSSINVSNSKFTIILSTLTRILIQCPSSFFAYSSIFTAPSHTSEPTLGIGLIFHSDFF